VIAMVLLAAALTSSGVLAFAFWPICVELIPPRPGWFGNFPEAFTIVCIFFFAPLLGFLLAWLATLVRSNRWIGSLLFMAWIGATVAVFVVQPDFERPTDLQLWLNVSVYALVIVLLFISMVLALRLLGSLSWTHDFNPLFMFSFVVLGCAIGLCHIYYYWENVGTRPWYVANIDLGARIGVVVTLAFYLIANRLFGAWNLANLPTDTRAQSPPPGWLRRMRWMLLSATPAIVVIGMIGFVSAEIQHFTIFWSLPWTFYFLSWLVALTRMTHARNSARVLVQALAVVLLLPLLWWITEFDRFERPWTDFSMFMMALLVAVFALHRMTLPLQGSLLALVLLLMHLQMPLEDFWAILVHVSYSVATCWGCHGDVVKDAPERDRLPEFLLCVLAGFVVGVALYLVVLEFILKSMERQPIVDYTIVLVAGVVVRIMPWPKSAGERDRGWFDMGATCERADEGRHGDAK